MTASRSPRWIRVVPRSSAVLDEDEVGEVAVARVGPSPLWLSLAEPVVEGFEGLVVDGNDCVRC